MVFYIVFLSSNTELGLITDRFTNLVTGIMPK